MAVEQTLREWATHDVTQQSICINYPVMESFELKYGLIRLLPIFRGLENEDPYMFLKEFHVVCFGMKPHNVTEDQIKLRAFPFALQDSAKDWFYYLPSGSVNTWNELARLFLKRYFPEVKASILTKEIIGIKQEKWEALHNYWERFQKLCARCPQHGIPEHQLLQYFIEGLAPLERRLINASSGGALLDKTPTQLGALITSIVEDSRHSVQEGWYADMSWGVKEMSTSHLATQISELTKVVLQLTKAKDVVQVTDQQSFQPHQQQLAQQRADSTIGVSSDNVVKSLDTGTQAFQQEARASIKNMEKQIVQLANSVSKIEFQGTQKEDEFFVEKNDKEKKEVPKPVESKLVSPSPLSPFPSRLQSVKREREDEVVIETFPMVEKPFSKCKDPETFKLGEEFMDVQKKARYDTSKIELPITNPEILPFIPQAPD
ncbi:hypothetical protein QVD17_05625 [Tagetes erecta]|uniref:Retrotransposon gag domain-containing protein n=1 Tax=Tagetes erecta TaxID=13708 RepID=A0AAD8PBB0_TARER|nr:hypothetical protein QVD17_05625 [Tagetes erecta]